MVNLLMMLLCMMPMSVWAMSSMPQGQEEIAAGKVAPEFTLPTASGKTLSLTQARDGKKSILFFWATWCPHCHEELERLRQNYQTIESKGIKIILIDAGETRQDAVDYLRNQQIPIDSFLDEDNTISGLYGVVGIPSLFFIDEKGKIQALTHEFPSDYESRFFSK